MLAAKPSRKDPRVSPRPRLSLPSFARSAPFGRRAAGCPALRAGPAPLSKGRGAAGRARSSRDPSRYATEGAAPPRRDGEETALRARDQERRLRRRHLEWGREAAVTISHRIPARRGVWRSGLPGGRPSRPHGGGEGGRRGTGAVPLRGGEAP